MALLRVEAKLFNRLLKGLLKRVFGSPLEPVKHPVKPLVSGSANDSSTLFRLSGRSVCLASRPQATPQSQRSSCRSPDPKSLSIPTPSEMSSRSKFPFPTWRAAHCATSSHGREKHASSDLSKAIRVTTFFSRLHFRPQDTTPRLPDDTQQVRMTVPPQRHAPARKTGSQRLFPGKRPC